MAERVSEIYSLLIPLVDGRLIVPRACVAEVIGFQPPAEMAGAPPWYLGTVPWNGRTIPLVCFEGMCSQGIPPATGRSPRCTPPFPADAGPAHLRGYRPP